VGDGPRHLRVAGLEVDVILSVAKDLADRSDDGS